MSDNEVIDTSTKLNKSQQVKKWVQIALKIKTSQKKGSNCPENHNKSKNGFKLLWI